MLKLAMQTSRVKRRFVDLTDPRLHSDLYFRRYNYA